jgi:hypothetical protein
LEIQILERQELLFLTQKPTTQEGIQILEHLEIKLQNQEHIHLEMIHLEPYLLREVPTLVAEEVPEDLAEAALLEAEDLAAVVEEEDKKTHKTC